MSIFSKKKLIPEDIYRILPTAKSTALEDAIKNKRLSRLDLKKDMARFMQKHREDILDKRKLGRVFKFKAIE